MLSSGLEAAKALGALSLFSMVPETREGLKRSNRGKLVTIELYEMVL